VSGLSGVLFLVGTAGSSWVSPTRREVFAVCTMCEYRTESGWMRTWNSGEGQTIYAEERVMELHYKYSTH
jgi:hypothetical protein